MEDCRTGHKRIPLALDFLKAPNVCSGPDGSNGLAADFDPCTGRADGGDGSCGSDSCHSRKANCATRPKGILPRLLTAKPLCPRLQRDLCVQWPARWPRAGTLPPVLSAEVPSQCVSANRRRRAVVSSSILSRSAATSAPPVTSVGVNEKTKQRNLVDTGCSKTVANTSVCSSWTEQSTYVTTVNGSEMC